MQIVDLGLPMIYYMLYGTWSSNITSKGSYERHIVKHDPNWQVFLHLIKTARCLMTDRHLPSIVQGK
jgi:hypothetical protein